VPACALARLVRCCCRPALAARSRASPLTGRRSRQLLRRTSSNFHLPRLAVVWLHSECVCRHALPPEPWGDRQQVGGSGVLCPQRPQRRSRPALGIVSLADIGADRLWQVVTRSPPGFCPASVSREGVRLNSRFSRATPRSRGPRRGPANQAAEEIVQHIRQCRAGGSNIIEGHTGDVFVAAKSRKMAKHVAGVCIAEHEPWIALVGHAPIDLDMNTLQLQGSFSLLKNTQFQKGPIGRWCTAPSGSAGVPTH
jgi:hypothetical protein